MSENWDFYFCNVDSKSASIFLDLGIAQELPKPEYPLMSYLRIKMNEPREDGLSSSEEYQALCDLEDNVIPELTSDGSSIYVGRNTSDGCRDFYFYSKLERKWEEACEAAMKQHAHYQYDAGTRSDPGWGAYCNFLFPSGRDWQVIQNRRVCDNLLSHGDMPDQFREIDHWISFPDKESRDRFLEEVRSNGFLERQAEDTECMNSRFKSRVFRKDCTRIEHINDVVLYLFDTAQINGGDYDGWETPVIA